MARRSPFLVFAWKSDKLTPALSNLPRGANRVISDVVKQTSKRAYDKIRYRTPVDRGVKGGAFSKWRKRIKRGGLEGVIENDAPYINVLEFGGYPVRKARSGTRGGFRRGKALLGGLPPGPRTQRAPGGEPRMRSNVSRQAPRGMVRITLQEIEPQFLFDLEHALDRYFAGL